MKGSFQAFVLSLLQKIHNQQLILNPLNLLLQVLNLPVRLLVEIVYYTAPATSPSYFQSTTTTTTYTIMIIDVVIAS